MQKTWYELTNELQKTYREISRAKENNPQWAVHKTSNTQELVHCPIPFVGKRYADQPVKVLLYASAENLSNYKG